VEWREVEVLREGPRLEIDTEGFIPTEEQESVPDHPIAKGKRRSVEKPNIYREEVPRLPEDPLQLHL